MSHDNRCSPLMLEAVERKLRHAQQKEKMLEIEVIEKDEEMEGMRIKLGILEKECKELNLKVKRSREKNRKLKMRKAMYEDQASKFKKRVGYYQQKMLLKNRMSKKNEEKTEHKLRRRVNLYEKTNRQMKDRIRKEMEEKEGMRKEYGVMKGLVEKLEQQMMEQCEDDMAQRIEEQLEMKKRMEEKEMEVEKMANRIVEMKMEQRMEMEKMEERMEKKYEVMKLEKDMEIERLNQEKKQMEGMLQGGSQQLVAQQNHMGMINQRYELMRKEHMEMGEKLQFFMKNYNELQEKANVEIGDWKKRYNELLASMQNQGKEMDGLRGQVNSYYGQLQAARMELSNLKAAYEMKRLNKIEIMEKLRTDNMTVMKMIGEEKEKVKELEEGKKEEARKYENSLVLAQLGILQLEGIQQKQMDTLRTLSQYHSTPHSTNAKLEYNGEEMDQLQANLDFLASNGSQFRFGDQILRGLKVLPMRAGEITTSKGIPLHNHLQIDENMPLIFWYGIQVPLIWIEWFRQ